MPCLSMKMLAKNVIHRNIRHSWQKASYLEQAQRGSFAGKRTISLTVILVKRGCCGNMAGATPASSTGTFAISEETQADFRVPFCPLIQSATVTEVRLPDWLLQIQPAPPCCICRKWIQGALVSHLALGTSPCCFQLVWSSSFSKAVANSPKTKGCWTQCLSPAWTSDVLGVT